MSRVVLVTGGSRGIGLSCARSFQAAGDTVAITYRTTKPDLDGPIDTHVLFPVDCDVTDPGAVEAGFAAIEALLGPVDVLVCAAGITDDGLLMRMDDARWNRVIETNLTGSFRVARRAIGPMVKARSGRIIFISSVVGMAGNAGQANYAASKAGLIGLARSLAREVASRNITVNVVAPGLVATDMLDAVSDARREEIERQIPLGRIAEAGEIASVVEFLASPGAAYLTGAVIDVDGGLAMGH